MNSLSSPTEAILSAAQTVFGRMVCYCGACWVGMIIPAIPQAIIEGELGELVSILLQPWLIIPVAFVSFFSGFGLLIYPLCLAFAIYFIREELSFKWLLLPMGLIALDTALMAFRWGIL
jgi:hypothetical protein